MPPSCIPRFTVAAIFLLSFASFQSLTSAGEPGAPDGQAVVHDFTGIGENGRPKTDEYISFDFCPHEIVKLEYFKTEPETLPTDYSRISILIEMEETPPEADTFKLLVYVSSEDGSPSSSFYSDVKKDFGSLDIGPYSISSSDYTSDGRPGGSCGEFGILFGRTGHVEPEWSLEKNFRPAAPTAILGSGEAPFQSGVSNEVTGNGVTCHVAPLQYESHYNALNIIYSCGGGPVRHALINDISNANFFLDNGAVVRFRVDANIGKPSSSYAFSGSIAVSDVKNLACTGQNECPFNTYCDKDRHTCVMKERCDSQEKNPDLSKINLAFISDDFDSKEEFTEAVTKLTGSSWVDYAEKTETPLFSFEPFKSNRDKFNVLLLYRNQRFGLIDTVTQNGEMRTLSADGEYFMSDMQEYCVPRGIPIVLSRQGFISTGGRALILSLVAASEGSNGEAEIFKMCVGKEICNGRILTHELGHAFGGLKDEYEIDGGVDLPGYPNCAPDKETAKHWWGDLEGEGIFGLNIGYFNGCSYASDNIRPTKSSIMGSGQYEGFFPGFGAVNERQLERAILYWNLADKPERD